MTMRDAPQSDGALRRLLLRDQIPIATALAGITIISWAYLFLLAHQMPRR